MMKQTMQAAIMMEVTVVEDVPTQTTVQIVSDCADSSIDPYCCECHTIVVSLLNDALFHQSAKQGIYQRAGKGNGKQAEFL